MTTPEAGREPCSVCGRLTGGCCAVMTTPEARKPHCCPVCHGAGTVSRPPWVAGDQPTWDTNTIEFYECRACKGSGIVWETP